MVSGMVCVLKILVENLKERWFVVKRVLLQIYKVW